MSTTLTTLTTIASLPTLLPLLQLLTILLAASVAGLSLSFSAWIIPIIRLAPSPKTQLAQFDLLITNGIRYLLPGSRIFGICLILQTLLVAQHPDPEIAQTWRNWATAVGVLVPVFPWEIYTIFPLNDRLREIQSSLVKSKSSDSDISTAQKKEIADLLRKWQTRNLLRAAIPLAVAAIGLSTILGQKAVR